MHRVLTLMLLIGGPLALGATPAHAAADHPVAVNVDSCTVGGTPSLTLNPTNLIIPNGDTVTFTLHYTNSSTTCDTWVMQDPDCPSGQILASMTNENDTATVSPPNNATIQYNVIAIAGSATHNSGCVPLLVSTGASVVPAPDIPETPFVIALPVVAAFAFGGGFLLLRRRAVRTAA
jgi:hypothetical protein